MQKFVWHQAHQHQHKTKSRPGTSGYQEIDREGDHSDDDGNNTGDDTKCLHRREFLECDMSRFMGMSDQLLRIAVIPSGKMKFSHKRYTSLISFYSVHRRD